MKPILLILAAALAMPLLPGCASNKDASAREWQRAECNKVLDKEDRDRCLRRAGL